MSYLVLARKYRPRQFSDLVGQEHVAKTLSNAIALDRVHHAFLFTGARGVGKTSAARILAMSLSCEKGPTAEPCGTCGICQEIVKGQCVDILEIDGASNTGVDDVRALREGVRYAPGRARKKIYIIDEVHMLSTNAFNALLKTLEEPPSHAIFILATTEAHKIPATIMSRVQRYDFKLIPSTRLVQHLASILDNEAVVYDEDALRVVARQAAGSVRDSLSLLDQVIAFVGTEPITVDRVASVLGLADKGLLIALTDAILHKDPGSALRALAQAVDRGVDLTQVSRSLQSFFHDVEIVGVVEDPIDVVDLTRDEIVEAKALYAKAEKGIFAALFDRWTQAVEDAAKAASPRLVYEMALVDLCYTEANLPLGDLIARLEEMEARLASGGGPSGHRAPRPLAPGPDVASASASTGASSGEPSRPLQDAGNIWQRSEATLSAATTSAASSRPPQNAVVRMGVDSPKQFWRSLKDQLMSISPLLAAAMEHTEVESITPGSIALIMGEKFQIDQVEKSRSKIEALASEMAGEPMRIGIRQGATAAGAALASPSFQQDSDRQAGEKKERNDEARMHPMIIRAQDLFGAKIRAVKTL